MEDANNNGTIIKCFNCNSEIENNITVCPYCNTVLVCTCTSKCTSDAVNDLCAVCKNNYINCNCEEYSNDNNYTNNDDSSVSGGSSGGNSGTGKDGIDTKITSDTDDSEETVSSNPTASDSMYISYSALAAMCQIFGIDSGCTNATITGISSFEDCETNDISLDTFLNRYSTYSTKANSGQGAYGTNAIGKTLDKFDNGNSTTVIGNIFSSSGYINTYRDRLINQVNSINQLENNVPFKDLVDNDLYLFTNDEKFQGLLASSGTTIKGYEEVSLGLEEKTKTDDASSSSQKTWILKTNNGDSEFKSFEDAKNALMVSTGAYLLVCANGQTYDISVSQSSQGARAVLTNTNGESSITITNGATGNIETTTLYGTSDGYDTRTSYTSKTSVDGKDTSYYKTTTYYTGKGAGHEIIDGSITERIDYDGNSLGIESSYNTFKIVNKTNNNNDVQTFYRRSQANMALNILKKSSDIIGATTVTENNGNEENFYAYSSFDEAFMDTINMNGEVNITSNSGEVFAVSYKDTIYYDKYIEAFGDKGSTYKYIDYKNSDFSRVFSSENDGDFTKQVIKTIYDNEKGDNLNGTILTTYYDSNHNIDGGLLEYYDSNGNIYQTDYAYKTYTVIDKTSSGKSTDFYRRSDALNLFNDFVGVTTIVETDTKNENYYAYGNFEDALEDSFNMNGDLTINSNCGETFDVTIKETDDEKYYEAIGSEGSSIIYSKNDNKTTIIENYGDCVKTVETEIIDDATKTTTRIETNECTTEEVIILANNYKDEYLNVYNSNGELVSSSNEYYYLLANKYIYDAEISTPANETKTNLENKLLDYNNNIFIQEKGYINNTDGQLSRDADRSTLLSKFQDGNINGAINELNEINNQENVSTNDINIASETSTETSTNDTINLNIDLNGYDSPGEANSGWSLGDQNGITDYSSHINELNNPIDVNIADETSNKTLTNETIPDANSAYYDALKDKQNLEEYNTQIQSRAKEIYDENAMYATDTGSQDLLMDEAIKQAKNEYKENTGTTTFDRSKYIKNNSDSETSTETSTNDETIPDALEEYNTQIQSRAKEIYDENAMYATDTGSQDLLMDEALKQAKNEYKENSDTTYGSQDETNIELPKENDISSISNSNDSLAIESSSNNITTVDKPTISNDSSSNGSKYDLSSYTSDEQSQINANMTKIILQNQTKWLTSQSRQVGLEKAQKDAIDQFLATK